MEIAIIAKFKNNNLRRRRETLGFPSIKDFCREYNIHYSQYWSYESFRDYPKKDFLIKKFERIFKCPIEDLFPPEYKEAVDRKLGKKIEKIVTLRELPPYMENAYLLPSPEELYEKAETKEQIEEALKTITEREAKVLKLIYYEDLTLGEVGQRLNVSRERIRQIEGKALRKLKHPSRSRKFRCDEREEKEDPEELDEPEDLRGFLYLDAGYNELKKEEKELERLKEKLRKLNIIVNDDLFKIKGDKE